MRQKILLTVFLLLAAVFIGACFWRDKFALPFAFSRQFPFVKLAEEQPPPQEEITCQDEKETFKRVSKSPAYLAKEKEVEILVQQIKEVDAEHRRLVQESKKAYPLFDQEQNMTPEAVVALRKKVAAEQQAHKKAISDCGAELRRKNLELKAKRRELRKL